MMAYFWRSFAGGVVALALLSPAVASAKGFVLVTWGETITRIGTASAQAKQAHVSSNVGYKYRYFGVFWVDLWTHGGTYCVYDGKLYEPISSAEAARLLGKSESELGAPFFYHVPLGWMIFGPLIVIGIIVAALKKDGTNGVALLFQEARYQKALDALNERYATRSAEAPTGQPGGAPDPAAEEKRFQDAYQAGVEYLVNAGVAREEAARNLAVMIRVLAQAGQQEAGAAPETEAVAPRTPTDVSSLPKYPG
jgi:hypothetical protein